MGQTLLDEESVFLEAVMSVDALYGKLSGWSLLAELRARADQSRLTLTEIAQPVLFALQVGLTRLLAHRGVVPVAVCGHSVGEVAAAWASGALTLAEAVRVVFERSTHQAPTRGQGCMTAVTLSHAVAARLLETLELDRLIEIAAINSAHSITLAGGAPAMTRLEGALTQRHIVFQRLALDYAFHSAAMDPIHDGLVESLHGLEARDTILPMYSSVSGTLVDSTVPAVDLGPSYWWRNVREPVNFEAAIRAMTDARINTFVEIGPRAVLTTYMCDTTKPLGATAAVLPSLTRQDCGSARILALADQLELTGALRNGTRATATVGRFVDLPHYPWQRERYWQQPTAESDGRLTRRVVHPLLGYALAGEALRWENHLDVVKLPVYADHAVAGGAVFPAAGFVDMALAAGRERRRIERRSETASQVIEDLEIVAPLLLDGDRSCTVRMTIDAADGRFAITSRERLSDGEWRTHATGRLVDDCIVSARPPQLLPDRQADVGADAHYEVANSLGLHYGPAFRTVSAVWYRREGVLAALQTPREIIGELDTALLHPTYLDGAFQLLADLALRERRTATDTRQAFVPVRIERLELLQASVPASSALAQFAPGPRRSRRSLRADFALFDAAGATIANAHGVRFRAVGVPVAGTPRARWLATRAVPMPRRAAFRAMTLPAGG